MIAGAIIGTPKDDLLSEELWRWGELHPEIEEVARGSFRRKQPPEIKGSGYVVRSLGSAL